MSVPAPRAISTPGPIRASSSPAVPTKAVIPRSCKSSGVVRDVSSASYKLKSPDSALNTAPAWPADRASLLRSSVTLVAPDVKPSTPSIAKVEPVGEKVTLSESQVTFQVESRLVRSATTSTVAFA